MLVARSLMLAACCLKSLVLDACCLQLAAWCLWLEAWRLDLGRVSVLDTPFIVNFIRDDIPSPLFNIRFSAGHMLHSKR